MLCISTDRIKTQIQKTLLPGTQIGKVIRCGYFRHGNLTHVCFEPVHEFYHGNCIFFVSFPDIGNLYFVFYGFHINCGIGLIDHLNVCRDITVYSVISDGSIHQHFFPCRYGFYIIVKAFIRFGGDVVFVQIFSELWRNDLFLYIPGILRKRKEGQYYRYIADITASYVENPGDVIKRTDHVQVSFFFPNDFPYIRQFVFGIFSCVFDVKYCDRRLGHGWSVFPDDIDQIFIDIERTAFLPGDFQK